jgi:hypothetical protein
LLERQAAPQVGDDYLTFVEGQPLQGSRGSLRVEWTGRVGDKPSCFPFGCNGLVTAPPLCRADGAEGGVPHDPVKPGEDIVRRLSLGHEFEEGFLNDVLGRSAPLPRIQHQRGGVLLDQSP